MKPTPLQTLALAALAAPFSTWAHDGHGLPGVAHWHADTALALLAAVGGALWWLGRRGR